MSALERQEGGSHYKQYAIQPVEFIMANGLDYCTANVIKYVMRFRQKGGHGDLEKARHYIDLLEETTYGKKESSEKTEPRGTRPWVDHIPTTSQTT